jgi:hypothetical protein
MTHRPEIALAHSPTVLRSPAERRFLIASSADGAHVVGDGQHRPKRTLRRRRTLRGRVTPCTSLALDSPAPRCAAG